VTPVKKKSRVVKGFLPRGKKRTATKERGGNYTKGENPVVGEWRSMKGYGALEEESGLSVLQKKLR